MDDLAISRRQLLWLAFVFEGGMGLVGCLVGWLCGFPPWEYFTWHPFDVVWAAAATVPMLVVFLIIYRWPVGPFRGLKRLSDDMIAPIFKDCSPLDLAFVSLLAGFGEEFLFRGFLQPALSWWLGDVGGISAASVLFGLVHPFGVVYIILAALAGLYFGVLFYLTGNLLVPVLAHAAYDFVALLILTRPILTRPKRES